MTSTRHDLPCAAHYANLTHRAFPFMKLPAELRLMVYENFGPTYYPLPLRAGITENIFFHDFGLHLLQTSRLVATEATPVLQLPHPTLSFRFGGTQINLLRHFNTTRIIYRLLRSLEEGGLDEVIHNSLHLKEDRPGSDKSMLPEQPLRVETNWPSSITGSKTFKVWFRHSVEHLRKDPTVVVRILLGIDATGSQPFDWMNWYYPGSLRIMTDATMWKIRIQVVFVVPPQHADRFRYFMDTEARTNLGLTDKYIMELSDELAPNWPEETHDSKADLGAAHII